MVSLRQALIYPAAGQQRAARISTDRRRSFDRRTADRRSQIYPFETREARMHFAAQAAGFGVYDLDCATGDSLWSPELRIMAGLPPDPGPLSTEQAEALIHPEDRQRFADKLQASLDPAGSGEFEDEYRLLAADGSCRWVRTKGRTFFAGEGKGRLPLAATGIVMDLTASRAAARQLAESREELDKMAAAAIDAIVTIDADQRIVRFNPAAERMFGCPAAEALGSQVERFMPERYRATHPDKVREFAQSESSAHVLDGPRRFTGLRADGEEFPFEATITKVSVDGRSRMTTFMRDISDRVRAEEALRHSMEDLELAVRAGHIGTWFCNYQAGTIELSGRCRQIFGIADGDPVSHQRLMETIHPEDREKVETAIAQSLRQGDEYKVEFRSLWPDGSCHWIYEHGRNVRDPVSEEVLGLRGISLDISERKAVEEDLRRSKEDLELAARGANMGIWTWDLGTARYQLSERCLQLFGIPPGEIVNLERMLAALHPEDQERAREMLRRAVEEGAEYKIEKRFIWPDGSVHWVECIGRELFDDLGRAVGMRGIALDISERKAAEEALRRSKEELEARVEARTVELLRSNEALERSNLELQQFAFIAAHDLQTPLRSISGFAQLLQKEYGGRFDAQADQWLQQLLRSSLRMHELIRDLLVYSRVESRGASFQPVDCNQLFDDVVDTLEGPIRESGARITRDPLPVIMGDRTQLAQVLQNLIDNGLKYHNGDPRIHVSAARTGEEWLLSVRDNGIGMAEKHLEDIFDIFRRLHTQEKYPGTGIGLAICRRVVQRHGGRIWAESRPGEGSVFYFTLPDRKEADPGTDS